MRGSGRKTLLSFFSFWAWLACAPPAGHPWQGADPTTWQTIRDALEAQRSARPRRPWAAGLLTTMREPRGGLTIDGRGAIAVAPGRALRMILVGAAGVTMLDAWVTPDQWRIAVPPTGMIRRSDEGASSGAGAGLPVDFLRWLFFRPLEGTLFAGTLERGRARFLLRDDGAVIDVRLGVCARGELTTTTRRSHGRSERLDECRASGAALGPGDWVRYESEASGLRVDLAIESVAPGPPAEAAFLDPDREGTSPTELGR
jgi:hypothetical protein